MPVVRVYLDLTLSHMKGSLPKLIEERLGKQLVWRYKDDVRFGESTVREGSVKSLEPEKTLVSVGHG